MKTKVLFFTSARSEYGLLKPLIDCLYNHPKFEVSIIAAGAHFIEEQGLTYLEIINDGYQINKKIDYLKTEKAKSDIIYANAILQIEFNDYLKVYPTDILIIMGDRSELIPVVSTAMLTGTPVAHISGGEITEGSTDNQVRHSVTKMSHLHFTATEQYKSNILKMGEEEWRVCVCGEPGLDSVSKLPYISKDDLFQTLGLNKDKKTILSTFHSETIGNKIDAKFLQNLVVNLIKNDNYQILFTAANVDIGGIEINNTIETLAKKYSNVYFIKSLGKLKYYSMMKYADLMLGNSSSGIVEAQSFQLPVINIGNRQKGRLRNENVIDVDVNIEQIIEEISSILTNENSKNSYESKNIYGTGNSCLIIADFLQNIDLKKLILKKSVFN
jgi:GDP/UDP-N,N'-diacetylbacillosamine 2-epimerase (hydrolysing)